MNTTGQNEPPQIEAWRALLHEGRFGDALDAMQKALPDFPDSPRLNKLIGVAHMLSGTADAAVSYFEKCTLLDPRNAEARFDLGAAREAAGDLKGAVRAYEAAIAEDADYADACNNLGLVLDRRGLAADAVRHLKRAVALRPDAAVFQSNLATILKKTGDHEAAINHFEKALELDPGFAQAYANYGDLLQFRNRLEDVARLLDRAKEHCGLGDPGLLDLQAHLATDRKDYAAAKDFLQRALDADPADTLKNRRLSLLGKTNDRLGDYDAAYRNFADANRYAAEAAARRGIEGGSYAAQVDDWIATMESGGALSPKPSSGEMKGRAPVFLVGFPRSGTTLLDTILRSHPDIDVLEELPLVSDLRRVLPGSVKTLPVPGLAPAQRNDLRVRYARSAREAAGAADAPVLVDKFPLNLVEAGLIADVFPDSKFVLALRNPYDCVLSCFMQSFDPNPAMANFFDLGDAARLYDRSMTLWTAYCDRLDLKIHTIRYEDVVADLRGAVSPLIEFLGLDWHDNLENYRETARERGAINTPSYNQVTQPVYRDAMDRWRNYADSFAPHRHLLDRWTEKWGYAT